MAAAKNSLVELRRDSAVYELTGRVMQGVTSLIMLSRCPRMGVAMMGEWQLNQNTA